MTSYVIAQVKFKDEPFYRRYQSRFAEVFSRFNGRLLVADEAPVVLDGALSANKIVVMAFPNDEEAHRFLSSPEYQEISNDRIAGADVVAVLVRGLE